MSDERIARIFAEANPVSTWEDTPQPMPASEFLANIDRPDPERATRPVPIRRPGIAVAAAVLAAVVIAVGAIVVLVDGIGGDPARPTAVQVAGTSTCDRADWLGGDEYAQSCSFDMSDPRVTGDAMWQWLVQLEDGTTGTYTGTLEITTTGGSWAGSFTGTSIGSSATFTAVLQGQRAYQGLGLELIQSYNVDSQQGELSGTIEPRG